MISAKFGLISSVIAVVLALLPSVAPAAGEVTYSSSDVPMLIPDNGSAGVDSTLTIDPAVCGRILDVNAAVTITHTSVGDLKLTLSHGSESVVVIDRPGHPVSQYGCSENNINAVLDDEAALPVEDECQPSDPAISGTFQPNNPLSAFNGDDASGTWTLNVADLAGADIGTLTAWSLIVTCEHNLTVSKDGTGRGRVAGDPGGNNGDIDCGSVCSAGFTAGTTVQLTGAPEQGSYLKQWTGALCYGNPCSISMDGPKSVAATFDTYASFHGSPESGGAPLIVAFTDDSLDSPVSWAWSFGDGGSSTQQNPIYKYATIGTYSVTLTTVGAHGSSARTRTSYVSVTSCPNKPVWINGTGLYYDSIQEGYNQTQPGAVLEAHALGISDDLVFDQNRTVTLQGGFDCAFTTNASQHTTVHGTITLGGPDAPLNSTILENIAIAP